MRFQRPSKLARSQMSKLSKLTIKVGTHNHTKLHPWQLRKLQAIAANADPNVLKQIPQTQQELRQFLAEAEVLSNPLTQEQLKCNEDHNPTTS
jgi:hypothetical protein